MKIFATIRFFWGSFIISFNTAVLMIPALMLFGKSKGTIVHHINRLTLFLIGGKAISEGTMDTSADIYVMNHQGIIDIIGLEALQNNHLRWIAKKELFDVFWFGNLLRHGEMISIDRGSKMGFKNLLKDVKESKEKLKRGVAIFPEGTRTNRQKLLKFKMGTKSIAEQLNLKVQPIVITGSKWILNEHNKTAHNGTVSYEFLDTITVDGNNEEWYSEIQDNMQKVIDYEYNNNNRSR